MLEFEDMQIIWDSQNNEKLFAINEAALFESVQQKSKAISSKLNKIDWIMIGVNLLAGVALFIDSILDNEPNYEFIVPIMYLGFFGLMLYRRFARRRVSAQFEPTLVGELDKGLWEINYIIEQARGMIWWYILPIYAVISVTMFLNGKIALPLIMMLVLFPLTYVGSQWEVDKWYLPKKQELETLKETLTAADDGE